ncbi:succinyl-diaminopimelate desuccinylase [Alteromonas halophila]|uniref:Succinyl-diaminopimelate desuccinylase n=2 Tax=Alteromonas halophila TaxID=516698 RepID=A0A918JKR5_9ALTE|nr:succinyl-diaminopimelate desuccinylase [Alteromonas halophila]
MPSVTPDDGGCQMFIAEQLAHFGFSCEHYQINNVSNLVARWGQGSRHIAFSGHTDVVPPGPLEHWQFEPFVATISESRLYGRGAADMKTGIAAMLSATARTVASVSPENVSFWWLITSDEEGEAEDGSKWIKQYLDEQGVTLDMCLVGEPSASQYTGDTIKVGRRGSLSASVKITGKQGHVAYPQHCNNAIHKAAAIIQALLAYPWDEGSADFPGTTLQVTHVDSGTFTDNLAPGSGRIEFNVRYSSEYNQASLTRLLTELIKAVDPTAAITWSRPCEAFLSQPRTGKCLIRAAESAIVKATGRYPLISTSGGTSDGRFFASEQTQVVELGVPNTSIHQVNENIHLSDLLTLEDVYTDMLMALFSDGEC